MNKAVLSRESWGRLVWRKTFRSPGARLGLVWICLLAFLAAFAPFLANSRPLLLRHNGDWASPALQAFTVADVAWLSGLLLLGLVLLFRLSAGKAVLLIAAGVILTSALAAVYLNPPQITVYETWRENGVNSGDGVVVNALIPYSAKDYQRDRVIASLQPPDARHWFGTEENGADVLSRMIHATRIALGTGFIATGIALSLGILVGSLMGYFSGPADLLGMRLVEVFEAVPTLFLLLAFVAFFGSNLYVLMVIIGITSWPGYARYVRAEFLRLRQQDFVKAAVVSGVPLRSLLFRHMLPNALAPILVAMSFGFASAILAEATLSFLGLGLVDEPSWGQMLNQAVRSSSFVWWMALFPGGAIFFTVLSYNLIGEALREAADPQSMQSR
ncbi:MAG: ABC transporter permease [Gammaproteobacteria bacterium]|nr:ABC transporter permease [Gammaproteobacteria bacterium]